MSGIPQPAGVGRFAFSSVIFLRLLAVIHIIAFASAWTQISGLIGPHGIAPADYYFNAAHQQLGSAAYWEIPTLCWVFGAHGFLTILCAGGVFVGLLLFAGIAPPVCLLLLWAGYLSLINAGQMFWSFQWDSLLLEATLLAVFVAPWRWLPWWRPEEPPRFARLLAWWLLFRLMFLAGVVKLASGDPTWRNLTALTFHYETQPLPTPLAWYAHQMPVWWHKLECAAMFVIELAVPFLLFTTRRLRHVAALVLAGFMGAIALTGNYTFFNGLAIVLCLFCLDDRVWFWVTRMVGANSFAMEAEAPAAIADKSAPTSDQNPGSSPTPDDNPGSSYPLQPSRQAKPPSTVRGWITVVFVVFAFGYTGALTLITLGPGIGAPPGMALLARVVEPLRSFNTYGLFAVMTHPRPELIIEGSNDAQNWKPYEFPAKPGDLRNRPTFVAPHQPRLDWQLWFAALSAPDQNPWVLSLCEHLLRGTPEVLRLIAKNPFPNHPPRYIRIVRYEYDFTDWKVRAETGQWWRRTPMDIYLGPVTLKTGP